MTTSSEVTSPSWISAFLDLEPRVHDRAVAFWQGVTGYELSSTRGAHDEFATLVPPDGDDFLRVQRLGSGPSRIHLDLHVVDADAAVRAAEQLGARVVARPPEGYVVLESPGGFVFCFVHHRASRRPGPATWPGGQSSIVDQVCLDIPAASYDAECRFWSDLTGWALTDGDEVDEFRRLERDDRLAIQLLLQRLDDEDGRVRAHLDLATTDRAAESARHEQLGATVLDPNPRGWTVLQPPAGLPCCITDREP